MGLSIYTLHLSGFRSSGWLYSVIYRPQALMDTWQSLHTFRTGCMYCTLKIHIHIKKLEEQEIYCKLDRLC